MAVDSQTAEMLERTVRNAVTLAVQRTGNVTAKDSMGYPLGDFEATEGCFADEPFDFPNFRLDVASLSFSFSHWHLACVSFE